MGESLILIAGKAALKPKSLNLLSNGSMGSSSPPPDSYNPIACLPFAAAKTVLRAVLTLDLAEVGGIDITIPALRLTSS